MGHLIGTTQDALPTRLFARLFARLPARLPTRRFADRLSHLILSTLQVDWICMNYAVIENVRNISTRQNMSKLKSCKDHIKLSKGSNILTSQNFDNYWLPKIVKRRRRSERVIFWRFKTLTNCQKFVKSHHHLTNFDVFRTSNWTMEYLCSGPEYGRYDK